MKLAHASLIALLFWSAGTVAAQDAPAPSNVVDPQKAIVIHQLLEVTGAINLSKQMLSRIIESQKHAHPDVDAKTWDRLAAKMDVNDMLASIVAIYDQHFSMEDLQATVAFYKSPAGQRMIKELPAAMNEAMTVGEEWGRKKAVELNKELQAEQLPRTQPD